MRDTLLRYSLPRHRPIRWLADAGRDVPHEIRVALIGSLYGTLPIFFGGVVNTIVVSALIAYRIPKPHFLLWLGLEVAICAARLVVLLVARRAAATGRPTPTDLSLSLALAWAASLGFGALISIGSGDWVAALLACFSAAGMVGGTCFRNFAAPRLTGAMIGLTLGPCCVGAALSGEPILLVTFAQIPFYLLTMSIAAFRLNRMLIATMRAERENGFRAHHDALTGLSNRAGLSAAADALSPQDRVGLLYLDLDGFKAVNDTHGHAFGDRLLQAVAERIRQGLAPADHAARIGGDEFIVLCRDRSRSDLIGLAERLIARIREPYEGADVPLRVGVSIGIALRPEHGASLADLMQAADQALYRSKAIGKSRCTLASRRPEPFETYPANAPGDARLSA